MRTPGDRNDNDDGNVAA